MWDGNAPFIEYYYHGNGYLPAHAHGKGEVETVKLINNGVLLKDQPVLSSQQKKIASE